MALQFGVWDVEALQASMTYRDFVRWQMYYKTHPFGDYRDDVRSAIASCTMANLWSKKKYKVDDFIPKFEEPKPMDWRVMKGILKGISK